MTVVLSDNIAIDGKIMETFKSIGIIPKVGVNPFVNTVIQEPVFNDTSLIAHYKFDDDTNIGLNSSSLGSILDATTNGTPTVVTDKYVIGKSSLFSGAGEDDALIIDSNSNKLNTYIDNKSITIAFWCWSVTSGQNGFGRIFYGSPTGSAMDDNSFQLYSGNGKDIRLIINRGSIREDLYVSTVMPALNTAWSHITLVIELKTSNINLQEHEIRTYVNGVLNTTFTNKYYPLLTNNYNFTIGKRDDNLREYDGYLDDFRIYNRVLTQNEITSLYFSKNTLVPITINEDYKYMSFVNTGVEQSQYSINFLEETECDILVVGGGGAGGKTDAGGGGAGGLIYDSGLFLNGTYNILVGKGGNINNIAGQVGVVGQNGSNTKISNTLSFNMEAIGGGGGGSGHPSDIESSIIGGSSGGLGTSDRIRNVGFTEGQGYYGGLGASADGSVDSGAGGGGGGGGGGAGGYGFDSPNGNGGIGRQFIITGTNTYYAGGGGGGHGNNTSGGLGGGGNGFSNGNSANATFYGGGGGGGGSNFGFGGSGFAGIVIIRYKTTKVSSPIIINEDYKYFSLTYSDIQDLVYDFGSISITNISTFHAYFNTIPGIAGVSSFDNFNSTNGGGMGAYPNTGSSAVPGVITFPLPTTHNNIKVEYTQIWSSSTSIINLYVDTFNNLNSSSVKSSITNLGSNIFEYYYNSGDYLKIEDPVGSEGILKKNLKITFSRKQSKYSITFPEETECDILIVGGGGGGGTSYATSSDVAAGGGGAGGLIFLENQTVPANTYIIHVGKGGDGDNFNDSTLPNRGKNGNNSSFSYHPTTAVGGGGGGSRGGNESGADGGSGGGVAWTDIGTSGQGIEGQGHDGAVYQLNHYSRGGGGAGAIGLLNNGGIGKFNVGNFNFKEDFGLPVDNTLGEFFNGNVYFAGGGNAGNNFTSGGKGGGASGSEEGTGLNGLNNTGGGGGGCRSINSTSGIQKLGGNGGSGIVLIRYKIIKEPFDAQWTYSSTSPSVYYLGNVGIGTTNPTSVLSVVGSVSASIGISAVSKSFKIEHPLNMNKWLYHGCVEAPRFDNIYRGKKLVTNGKSEVNIDNECNTTGGMTEGTFIALNTNAQLYLRNNQTFDGVKGSIVDGKIIINCQNITDEIEVDWLVIGERKDENVINVPLTSIEGNLICEHNIDSNSF